MKSGDAQAYFRVPLILNSPYAKKGFVLRTPATVSVRILGLADLIANKLASGRKQDLAHVDTVEVFRSGT